MATNFPHRRRPLKHNHATLRKPSIRHVTSVVAVLTLALVTYGQGPIRITLDEVIKLALQHNHLLISLRTTIQQSEAEEITQGLRPKPTRFADWEYLPLGSPAQQNPDV